jgi:hypothetical protein
MFEEWNKHEGIYLFEIIIAIPKLRINPVALVLVVVIIAVDPGITSFPPTAAAKPTHVRMATITLVISLFFFVLSADGQPLPVPAATSSHLIPLGGTAFILPFVTWS